MAPTSKLSPKCPPDCLVPSFYLGRLLLITGRSLYSRIASELRKSLLEFDALPKPHLCARLAMVKRSGYSEELVAECFVVAGFQSMEVYLLQLQHGHAQQLGQMVELWIADSASVAMFSE